MRMHGSLRHDQRSILNALSVVEHGTRDETGLELYRSSREMTVSNGSGRRIPLPRPLRLTQRRVECSTLHARREARESDRRQFCRNGGETIAPDAPDERRHSTPAKQASEGLENFARLHREPQ